METGQKRYEVLIGLPPYGPMYIPVTQVEHPFVDPYSEGFVVRFFQSDGSTWVANFNLGWTAFSAVYDFPETDLTVVIAGGSGYVMNRNQSTPINTFDISITTALLLENQVVLAATSTHITTVDANGQIWESGRISWDGIKDLHLQDKVLLGMSYDPMNDRDEWIGFTIDLETKQVNGGSYGRYYNADGTPIKTKSWWQF